MTAILRKAEEALRAAALALPEAYEEFPWGERALKVRGKIFVTIVCDNGTLSLSMKLPESSKAVLERPFATPMGYGLARSGWVTTRFGPRDKPPTADLRRWIEESYRAVAPKRLAAGV